ncbi:MAG: hypothetical protein AAB074_06500 [Planctomycetota bacterium]
MTDEDGTLPAPAVLRRAILLALALGACAAVFGFVHLARRLADARASGARLAGRLELAERGQAATEAIRGDLESALVTWQDDEAGHAWLSHCAFPVDATPAGGAALPANGRSTLLLLARPQRFADPSGTAQGMIMTVRLVAWYPAESPDAPALLSWESEPLASADWLATLLEEDRRTAVETLVEGGVRLAWSSAAASPRTLDTISGDVAVDEALRVTIRGTVRRWCGDAPGAPVLARGLGHPAFYVEFSGPPGSRRGEIHLTMELLLPGQEGILRRESVAVASGLKG